MFVDYGVMVVKIELFVGDEMCGWGLLFFGDMVWYFMGVNCNKEGFVFDLLCDEGCVILWCLFEEVDVFVENFKLGMFVCWGMDYVCDL